MDIIISAFRIEVKRGNINNALYWFKKLKEPSKIIFKLMIEDVGPASAQLPYYIYNMHIHNQLEEAVTVLCKCPKSFINRYLHTIFFNYKLDWKNLFVPPGNGTPLENFNKYLRKCVDRVQSTFKCNSIPWNIMDEYTLLYWCNKINIEEAWDLVMQLMLFFPEVIRDNVDSLYNIHKLFYKEYKKIHRGFLIQAILSITRTLDWDSLPNPSFIEITKPKVTPHAYDITTKKGRHIVRELDTLMSDAKKIGVEKYYMNSLFAENWDPMETEVFYRSLAKKLDISYYTKSFQGLENVYQDFRRIACLRELPPSFSIFDIDVGKYSKSYLFMNGQYIYVHVKNNMGITVFENNISNVKLNYIYYKGILRLPGYYDIQVENVPVDIMLNNLDKFKPYFQLYSTGYILFKDVQKNTHMFRKKIENEEINIIGNVLVQIARFTWLYDKLGITADFIVNDNRVYTINEKKGKMKYNPILTDWLETDSGKQEYILFKQTFNKLKNKILKIVNGN